MSKIKLLQKNSEVVLEIASLGFNGEGVARYGLGNQAEGNEANINNSAGNKSIVVFVKGALVGEKVLAKIIKVNSDYCVARLLEVRRRSPYRTVAPCPVFGKCGGCALQHLSYQQQLEFKRDMVVNAFHKYARMEVDVDRTVASPNEYRYRNKLSMPLQEKNGEIVFGFYRAQSHDIVPITDCVLQPIEFKTVIECVREYMVKNNLLPYNFSTLKGDIRHVVVRQSSNVVICSIVTSRASLPHLQALYEALCSKLQKRVGIYLNINQQNNNVIFGERFVHIAGETHGQEQILGLEASIHPAGFLQVNSGVCSLLYNELLQRLGSGFDAIIDAYSGGGTLTVAMSKCAKRLYAIEISREATDDAVAHAKRYGIDNITHILGDCAEQLPRVVGEVGSVGSLAIVLDPPRKGCSPEVVQAVNQSGASRIAYISCNPATLARDVALLSNYTITSATPFDMFPQTANIETLCTLERTL